LTGSAAGGLVAALAAAVLYGSAPVAQTVAARRTAAGGGLGLALTLRLARQWIWLLGLGCEIGAFVLEAVAFLAAPATLVAPVMACDMLVFVVLGRWAFGARLSALGVTGAVSMGCGVGLLALAFRGDDTLGKPASNEMLLVFLAVSVGVAGLGAVLGSRALAAGSRTLGAAAFGAASGVAYGFATMATRQVGRTFTASDPWHLFVTPTPYVLGVCSILGITMMQRGLQNNPVVTFPLASAISAFLPVVLGATLLGDVVPTGATEVAFVVALALLATGVALIGRDRSAAEEKSEAGAVSSSETRRTEQEQPGRP
jgi:hypothetical protein